MTSKEALEQIMGKYIFYVPARSEGKEHLLNCLNIVAKDLERLEKLEKILDILKDDLWVYEKGDYRLSVNGSHDYQELTHNEYKLLKEVFEDE